MQVPPIHIHNQIIVLTVNNSRIIFIINVTLNHVFSRRFDLDQLNYFPTRGESVLDLVFTNDKLILSDLIVGPPFGSSDHDSLFLTLLFNNDSVKSTTVDNNNNWGPSVAKLNWKLIDWKLCSYLCSNIDWFTIISASKRTDDCWD